MRIISREGYRGQARTSWERRDQVRIIITEGY